MARIAAATLIATVISPAYADGLYIDAALGFETTSTFRGVKSDKPKPAPYGYVEVTAGEFYGGVFSNPAFIQDEWNALAVLYAVWAPAAAGLDFDIGGRYYAFPGSSDFEYDFEDDGVIDHAGRKGLFEALIGAEKNFDTGRVSGRVFYTPDGFAETGPAWYFHGEARIDIVAGFEARAGAGYNHFAKTLYNDNYIDYNVGIYKTAFGFDMFVRYSDTDGFYGTDNSAVVFGLEKMWSLRSPDADARRRYRKILNDWVVDKSLFAISR
ncbi:MAG: TorF family putative porin [Parvularculaceae bacterium]